MCSFHGLVQKAHVIETQSTGLLRGYTFIWAIRDVPLNRVCFFGLAVLNRVYHLTCLNSKQGQNLS